MSSIIYVLCASAVSLIVLFALSRLIGNRQISELSLFDYINSITIGSIAAELAASDNLNDSLRFLTAMVFYGIITMVLAVIANKSKRARSVLEGKPIVLMKDGKMYRDGFKKAHLDINEFQADCRLLGYFDLSSIDTALIEANGKISILPSAAKQPLTVEAAGATSTQEHMRINVIADGRILSENLHLVSRDDAWLSSELKSRNLSPEDVFLATTEDGTELKIFTAEPGEIFAPF